MSVGKRVLIAVVAVGVSVASIKGVQLPPGHAINAIGNAIMPVSGSGAYTGSISSLGGGYLAPPQIEVVDNTTGERRIGPQWLAKQPIADVRLLYELLGIPHPPWTT